MLKLSLDDLRVETFETTAYTEKTTVIVDDEGEEMCSFCTICTNCSDCSAATMRTTTCYTTY